MDSLPTPAPSSDPPMPGSSPIKRKHPAGRASAPFASAPGLPLTSLDLNLAADRVKAFHADRQKAGQTPPPSSPTALAPSSSPPAPVSGASPCKEQRMPRRSDVSVPLIPLASHDAADHTAPTEPLPIDVGLEPNPDGSEAAEVPHLLWACRTHSLVVGRSKPSGMPHASWRKEQDGVVLSQDVQLLQSIAPSTQGLGARRLVRVNLPNEARHVSRVHAIIEWIPFIHRGAPSTSDAGPSAPAGTYIVRIVGQNGLIVDGKRRREGQVLRLTAGRSTLDFFGVKCRFQARAPPSAKSVEATTRGLAAGRTAVGLSPVKRLSFAQLWQADPTPGAARPVVSSSPPPTSELHFSSSSSPSKSSVGSDSPTKRKSLQSSAPPSAAPRNKAGAGEVLKAGADAQRRLMIGASDDEGGEDDEDEDEDDEDDDDYVPEPVSTSRKPSEARSTQLDDAPASRAATPSTTATVQGQAAKAKAPPPTTAKRASPGHLTESQTRMPPPAVAVTARRSVSRRSASNSPAPGSPMLGGPALATVQDWQGLARRCVRLLAPTYDLAGLLVGAIVFHRTATISASEASSPMFGVIHRAGKDASGNPLECWYYYDKENDPDRERADNLGAFAKPMRKAIKGQKPIFWKKSGYGSRKDDFETPAPPAPAAAVRGDDLDESINMAVRSLPTSAIETQRLASASASAGSKRRRGDESAALGTDDDEARREMLRAKIARSGVWDETQPEEKEPSTWDKVGDLDWKKSRG
ncbi:uncharacterized protein PFL1_01911 [Pseudozyma flocculosa PF-1]|uniref:uncharacterized protein n=1 Tax=Pseudozyma flocculosa PF-1 TaxID=1277687 RepID=UPI0004560A75|nr:uncharacterized protein PFL1_01911 [Pseudozyma flocculosa PF-1]EPQ30385.1 hypothetical protein PFL1_01911 [Pseudozyma flocculosa PF-1]